MHLLPLRAVSSPITIFIWLSAAFPSAPLCGSALHFSHTRLPLFLLGVHQQERFPQQRGACAGKRDQYAALSAAPQHSALPRNGAAGSQIVHIPTVCWPFPLKDFTLISQQPSQKACIVKLSLYSLLHQCLCFHAIGLHLARTAVSRKLHPFIFHCFAVPCACVGTPPAAASPPL